MSEDKDTHRQAEEDAQEDLELKDEEADKVGGAATIKLGDLNVKKVIDKSSPTL